ncbi:MAG: hypothetical protein GWP06_00225 [Actinobacteria bacterium]|nr:hypothetical protein [Actinomycetota bacterium]
MTEKEHFTQKEFADRLGVSAASISKARNPKNGKPPTLQYWKETGKIYIDDPLTQAFIKNPTRQRLKGSAIVQPKTNGETISQSDIITQAIEKKAIEEALLKEEQRKHKQLTNAILRGEYVKIESINQSIMMFLDKKLNTDKRYFSAIYDEIVRETLAKGEKIEGLKQKFLNEMELAADESKNTVCDKLEEIQTGQAK